MERTTWMIEERIGASATGAPMGWACDAAASAGLHRNQKQLGFVPAAYGPGLVSGGSTVTFHTIDHVEMGRTAQDGTPLASPGAGYG